MQWENLTAGEFKKAVEQTCVCVITMGEGRGIPGRLATALRKEVDDQGLTSVYEEIDAPLVPVLARMEDAGVKIDLAAQTVTRPDGVAYRFDIDPFRKECLLHGWDDIGLTLRHADIIKEFEARRRIEQPWLFA